MSRSRWSGATPRSTGDGTTGGWTGPFQTDGPTTTPGTATPGNTTASGIETGNESFIESALNATGSNVTDETMRNATPVNYTVANNTTVSADVPALPIVGEPSLPEQLFLTVVILLAVIALRYGVHWARGQYDRDDRNTVLGLLDAGGVAIITTVGVIAIIELWGWFPILVAAVENATTGDTGTRQVALELVLAVVLLGGAYAVTGFLGRVMQILSERAGVVTRHQREVIYRTTQVLVYAIVGIAILNLVTGGDIGSLLVGAGFLGIVIGMAARKTLGSVLAGFVLMVSRPFEIGDWIEVDTYEGIVTDITIVNTRIRTAEGEYVVVPNDVIENETLVNRSREGNLRIEVEVGVDYDADVRETAELAREEIAAIESVEESPQPQVVLKEFADSSVVMGARGWISEPSARRRWETRSEMVGAIKERFDEEGVTIPFPQRTLTDRDDTTPVIADGEAAVTTDDGASSAAAGADGTQGGPGADPAATDGAGPDAGDAETVGTDEDSAHDDGDDPETPTEIDGEPVPGTTAMDGDATSTDPAADDEGADTDGPTEIDGEPVPGTNVGDSDDSAAGDAEDGGDEHDGRRD
jgi:small-conductance mechanosensitive channel